MKRCETCKYYSCLIVVPSGYGECKYCQKNHCVYCEQDGKLCGDYEQGENDGGKLFEEYEESED